MNDTPDREAVEARNQERRIGDKRKHVSIWDSPTRMEVINRLAARCVTVQLPPNCNHADGSMWQHPFCELRVLQRGMTSNALRPDSTMTPIPDEPTGTLGTCGLSLTPHRQGDHENPDDFCLATWEPDAPIPDEPRVLPSYNEVMKELRRVALLDDTLRVRYLFEPDVHAVIETVLAHLAVRELDRA